jgi:hypothetical protein
MRFSVAYYSQLTKIGGGDVARVVHGCPFTSNDSISFIILMKRDQFIF